MDRRFILRCSAMGMALPALESLDRQPMVAAEMNSPPVKRFVAIGSYLGFHTPSFNPSA